MPLRLPGRFLHVLVVMSSAFALAAVPDDASAQTFELLHGFHRNPGDPNPLLREGDGTLYGTTETGGTFSRGVLFRRAPDGTFAIVHEFSGADGNARRVD